MAAYAQAHALLETLNEYIRTSQHQEISAVSTSLCDECYRLGNNRPMPPAAHVSSPSRQSSPSSLSCSSAQTTTTDCTPTTAATFATIVRNNSEATPNSAADTSTALPSTSDQFVVDAGDADDDDILVDDDGYCEIDELRLPTVLSGDGVSFIPTPPASSINATSYPTTVPTSSAAIPDLKRQSTISADSIPEETEHEMHAEAGSGGSAAAQQQQGTIPESYYHIEMNDAYDTIQVSECAAVDSESCDPIDSSAVATEMSVAAANTMTGICGANRLAHVTSLAPAVPCHLITNYVTTLNSQISLLLVSFRFVRQSHKSLYNSPIFQPKLNERDIERENLRKENQHLRDLLNSMHNRERVSNERVCSTF